MRTAPIPRLFMPLVFLFWCVAGPAFAMTTVPSGTLGSSQTWTATGSPYILQGDLTVPAGVTLTLAADVVVQMGPGDDQAAHLDTTRTELRISGQLIVNGVSGRPVRVVSGSANPATGDFYGVVVLTGGAVSSSFLQVERGHRCIHQTGGTGTYDDVRLLDCGVGLTADGGGPIVNRAEVLRSTGHGVVVGTAATLTGSRMRVADSGGTGVLSDGALTLSSSVIARNGALGIVAQTTSAVRVSSIVHCTVAGNTGSGIAFSGSNVQATVRDTLSVSNGSYGISRSGLGTVTLSFNLVNGNATAEYNNLSDGPSSLRENPLLVDIISGDYRPTSNSGVRFAASDGTDMGALPYDGVATGALIGHLYRNLTLTSTGSPYTVPGDITVEPGVTLTIEPGVELRFSNRDLMQGGRTVSTDFIVEGTLRALGTSAAPILLTSAQLVPSQTDWFGLMFESTATGSVFEHVIIEYAVNGITYRTGTAPMPNVIRQVEIREFWNAGVFVDGGPVTLSQLYIHDGNGVGIRAASGSGTLQGSVVEGIRDGIRIQSGAFTVERNTIMDSGANGLEVWLQGFRTVVRNNIIVGSGDIGFESSSRSLMQTNNLVWDNATNYDGLTPGAGSLTANPLFVDRAAGDYRITSNSPARFAASDGGDMGAFAYTGNPTPDLVGSLHTNTILAASGSPYTVTGDLTVEPGVTLTIEPGVELRFATTDLMRSGADTARAELRVLGTLTADGTTTRNITLTSAGATPTAGDWGGVYLFPGSGPSNVDFATIEYGVYGIRSAAGTGTTIDRSTIRNNSIDGVYLDGGGVTLSDLVIRDNDGRGVNVVGANSTVQRCLIHNNQSRGIEVTNGSAPATLNVFKNSLYFNQGGGVYAEGTAQQQVIVRDNIIVRSGRNGISRGTNASLTNSYNIVWFNRTNWSGVLAGVGSRQENPLWVDRDAGDFRITSRSGARFHASDGTDMGALPYDGVLTVGETGYLYADTTWTGTVSVIGDITIEPGVTLSILPGTTVQFAAGSDVMSRPGSVSGTSQLRAYGRLLAAGTAARPIRFVSDAPMPRPGDWTGIRLEASSVNSLIRHAFIRHAQRAIESFAPSSALVAFTEIDRVTGWGMEIKGGALQVDGVFIHDMSRGIDIDSASPSIRNTIITRTTFPVTVNDSPTATNIEFDHLTVHGNSTGINISGTNSLSRGHIRNSVITSNGTNGIRRTGRAVFTVGANNVWDHVVNYVGVTAGPGSVSADPAFVNPAFNNFRYRSTSPNIDAADSLTALASDFYGTTRPLDGDNTMGARADLGAVEFDPAANRFPIADGGPDRVVTSGVPTTFTATASSDADGSIVGYTWNFGDGSFGAGATATHTFTGGTDRVVTLTVTDNVGATDVDTIAVEVNLAPVAEAGSARFGDAGELITFDGSASTDDDGTIASYQWDFGDGTTGNGATVSHRYRAGGNYTVTLTVTDDDGATNADTTTVNIGADSIPPSIIHSPVANGRTAGRPVPVTANVTDNAAVSGVTLFYRLAGAAGFTATPMASISGSTYEATIPGSAVTVAGVQYYLRAEDASTNVTLRPPSAPTTFLAFTVVAAPTITHTPIANGQPDNVAVTVSADVMAPTGVLSATLFYRRQGVGSFASTSMNLASGSTYSAQIPASAVQSPGVEYYIEAVDLSIPPNTVTSPASMGGVHGFSVIPSDTTPPAIVHTPVANGQRAGSVVAVSADVTDTTGVQSVTVWYRAQGGVAFASATMSRRAGSNFTGEIPASAVVLPAVEYYISATDTVVPSNTGTEPLGAPATVLQFTVQRRFNIQPGDLIVSEIMADPSGSEADREWFEVYNTTNQAIDLDGFSFGDDGTDSFTIDRGRPLLIAATGYFVFGRNSDPAANGGVTVGYEYSGLNFSNINDAIVIRAGTTVVDRVAYDAGTTFPRIPGRSLSLNPATLDGTSNDTGASWCPATSQIGSGDFGTPGTPNDPCLDLTAPQIIHAPIANGQPVGAPLILTALVTDNSTVAAVDAFYRTRGTGAYTALPMVSRPMNRFEAEIPGDAVTTLGVEYYLRAEDDASPVNEAFAPSTAPDAPYEFSTAVVDIAGPLINHAPSADPQPVGTPIRVDAVVTDPAGVDEVTLTYRPAGGAWQTVVMTSSVATTYQALIPGEAVVAPGVEYYLTAVDTLMNASALPPEGEMAPFVRTVVVPDTEPPIITHTPIVDGQPAENAVVVDVMVEDDSALLEVRLYFRTIGTTSFLAVSMTGNDGAFSAEIPATVVTGGGIEYYIEAVDDSPAQNVALLPAGAPTESFSFTLAADPADSDGPTILHIAESAIPPGRPLDIVAEIVDPSAVSEAVVLYRARGASAFSEVAMVGAADSDRFSATIPGSAVVEPAIEYYLRATDGRMNDAVRPAMAPSELFSVAVRADAPPSDDGAGCSCRDHSRRPNASSGGIGGLLVLGILLGWGRRRARRSAP